jgi:hypothetical protein
MEARMETNKDENSGISFLVLISGRKYKDALIAQLSDHGAHVVNTLYGKGTAGMCGYAMNLFGFVTDDVKVVITCLIADKRLQDVLEMLTDKFRFKDPNTGIAFTVPVDKLSY